MTIDKIREEVKRLGEAAGCKDWCPAGGWQFPFDFGNGIVAPTYTPVQAMHTWRRDVMLNWVSKRIPSNRDCMSVLDLGAGEGAMAIGLWQLGFRDITCVEVRELNVEKAQFAAKVFGANLKLCCTSVEAFLHGETRQYDIVLFMGLLYHLLEPFAVMDSIRRLARQYLILETALALPKSPEFLNRVDYAPSEAAFFLRFDTAKSQTAGISDLELWPNKAMVEVLMNQAGFDRLSWLDGPQPAPP
jgi:Methyltransferase domain